MTSFKPQSACFTVCPADDPSFKDTSCLSLGLDKDREKAKERYVKASVKLYDLHNEYVLSVRAAQVYHQQHHSQIQPALLSALQTLQEEMVLIL